MSCQLGDVSNSYKVTSCGYWLVIARGMGTKEFMRWILAVTIVTIPSWFVPESGAVIPRRRADHGYDCALRANCEENLRLR